jgi:hypothetical protein
MGEGRDEQYKWSGSTKPLKALIAALMINELSRKGAHSSAIFAAGERFLPSRRSEFALKLLAHLNFFRHDSCSPRSQLDGG